MTPNPPDRLDRIEALLEQSIAASNARADTIQSQLDQSIARGETIFLAIQQLSAQQQAAQAELRANIADVISMITTQAQEAEADRAVIREMQSEVRGLQTENRRIWEILQGRQGDDSGGDRA